MTNVIETAKASVIAYNEKNWDKARGSFVEKGVYDEKATGRRLQGINQIIEAWQGWAKAFPDSKATFVAEYAFGDTAVLELVWKGVQTGPLQMPTGTIAPSNKPIEMPACQVVKVEGGKVQTVNHYFDLATLLRQIGAFRARRAVPVAHHGVDHGLSDRILGRALGILQRPVLSCSAPGVIRSSSR